MPNESAHTVHSYEQELEHLRSLISQMGGLVERQTSQAIAAVVDHDEEAAMEAPELDPKVDDLERQTEALVIRLLALRAPMAGDLREVVSALKISGDLERIGDCAASIARRALRGELLSYPVSVTGLRSMGRLVQETCVAPLMRWTGVTLTWRGRSGSRIWRWTNSMSPCSANW